MGKITREFSFVDYGDAEHEVYCKSCSTLTSHRIMSSYEESGEEECGSRYSVDWREKNQTIQCGGCKEVSFRLVSTFSEGWEYDSEGALYYPEKVKYYPSRVEGLQFVDHYLLPDMVSTVYSETITALENEAPILAGIGIRVIIETVCKDLDINGKNLYEKIGQLKQRSIITEQGESTLHKLRELGNESAHEMKAYDPEQLELAMHIVKHMLDGTYVLPARTQKHFPDKK